MKLSKDVSSPLKVFESKTNIAKKEVVGKIDLKAAAKVNTTLQEVELNASTSASKIVFKETPVIKNKISPPSPKAVLLRNNFFK